jgi:SsrA-binding protein
MPALIENRKAHFDYEILEKYEAGIELLGFEAKALKNKKGSLEGAYVIVRGGEAYVSNLLISPYQVNNTPADYESRRNRKLILNKKEISLLAEVENGKGLTIVPISIYTKGSRIKLSIAIVRGKKKYDKRETIKKRDTDREISRVMKDR